MSENRRLPARILISPDEPRLRAGWRLLFNGILSQVIGLVLILPLLLIRLPAIPITNSEFLAAQLASVIAVTAAVFLSRRWLDRRSISSLGLQLERRSGLDLLAGFLIAGLMMLLIFLLEWLAGWLIIGAPEAAASPALHPAIGLLAMLAAFAATGWQEELYFRGYLLQNLRDGLNLAWAVGLSTLLFSLAHFANPNASAAGLAGILLAGFFMAYAYLASGRLWLPIGLHIGWNFFEGPVFGFPVSGLETFQLLPVQVGGPPLITGGAFGPEAGLVLLPALALGTLCVFSYTRLKPKPK